MATHPMLRVLARPITPVVVLALAGTTWHVADLNGRPRRTPASSASGSSVFHLDGIARYPTETAADWASVADFVATATVTSEKELPRATSETVSEDSDLIGRTVAVKVDDVLWRSPTTQRELPGSFRLGTLGWMQTASGKQEAAFADASRIEVGHQYVLALVWARAECAQGDDPSPAGWSLIGSGGALPADGEVIGNGELAGEPVSVNSRVLHEFPSDSLLARHAGKAPKAVAEALKATKAEHKAFQPETSNTCAPS